LRGGFYFCVFFFVCLVFGIAADSRLSLPKSTKDKQDPPSLFLLNSPLLSLSLTERICLHPLVTFFLSMGFFKVSALNQQFPPSSTPLNRFRARASTPSPCFRRLWPAFLTSPAGRFRPSKDCEHIVSSPLQKLKQAGDSNPPHSFHIQMNGTGLLPDRSLQKNVRFSPVSPSWPGYLWGF